MSKSKFLEEIILLTLTLLLYLIFVLFQILYIFIPLFTIKTTHNIKKAIYEEGITILVPAYNEQALIIKNLLGIINVDYRNYEVIFINDGSIDRTMDLLDDNLTLYKSFRRPSNMFNYESINGVYESKLYPYIYVIDKENGGKADALNAGLDFAKNNIIITLDADSILDQDSLTYINTAFRDETIISAGGTVHAGQGFTGSHSSPQPTFIASNLIRFQIIQYLTAFYLHKTTQAKINSITVISGAFGAFRKRALIEVKGFRKSIGEDMDITLKMQQLIKLKYNKHRLIAIPEAKCYTECPETFRELFKQRVRWQKAFIDCIFYYRKSFYKKFKAIPSTYLLLDSLLLGTINAFILLHIPITLILFPHHYMIPLGLFSMTYFLAICQSLASILISQRFNIHYQFRDYLKISLFIPVEVMTYRFLGILFVISGTISYFINNQNWSESKRFGSKTVDF